MSRIVTLSLTLKLELASQLEREHFYGNLEQTLRTGLGEILAESPDCVSVLGACDPEDVMSTMTELSPLLTPAEQIAVVWSADDVLEIRPDLTREQAVEVLVVSDYNHDAGFGINWETLESAAEELFGPGPTSDAESESSTHTPT